MKTCSWCRVVKPLEEFPRRASAKDGRNYYCKDCDNTKRKARRDADIETSRAKDNARYLVRRDAKRAYDREYYREHAKAIQERTAAYSEANRKALKPYHAQRQNKRRAKKIQATPGWANHDKIREFYEYADTLRLVLGEHFEVDHIVPLVSKLVCGLHTEANLQVVPRRENRTKCNMHWPDMP